MIVAVMAWVFVGLPAGLFFRGVSLLEILTGLTNTFSSGCLDFLDTGAAESAT